MGTGGGTGSGDWEGATWVEFNFWRRSFKGIKFLMLVDLAKLLRGGDREGATGRRTWKGTGGT